MRRSDSAAALTFALLRRGAWVAEVFAERTGFCAAGIEASAMVEEKDPGIDVTRDIPVHARVFEVDAKPFLNPVPVPARRIS